MTVSGGQDEEDDRDDGLVSIDPYASRIWYREVIDFAEGISDETAARRLLRALDGRGAFRRFRNELYEEYPELVAVCQELRTVRARRRAVRARRGRRSCRGRS